MTRRDASIRLSIFGASAIYVGLRLPGCYFIVACAAIAVLVASRRRLPGIVDRRLVCLGLYCFSLILQVLLSLGDGGLALLWDQRGQLLLPLNVLLLFACGKLLTLNRRYVSLIFFALSLSAVYGSVVAALWHVDLAASQLRPLENIYVIGCLSLAFWFANLKKESARFSAVAALLCLPLAFALPVFRGVLGILACSVLLVVLLGRCWTLFSGCDYRRLSELGLWVHRQKLIMLLLLMLISLVAVVGKGGIFRYTLYKIIGSNPLNGRAELLGRFARDLSDSSFVLLGSYPIAASGTWAHNYIVDTIAYHGWLPAFFLVMFLVVFCLRLEGCGLLVKAVILVMGIGALLQPIEFADGIAFQLSFLLLGFVSSSAASVKCSPSSSGYS